MPTDRPKLLEPPMPLDGRQTMRVVVEYLDAVRNEDTTSDIDRLHRPKLGAGADKAPVPDPDLCTISDNVDLTHEEAAGSDAHGLPGEAIINRCLRRELDIVGRAAIAAQLRHGEPVAQTRGQREKCVGQTNAQGALNGSRETIFRPRSGRSNWSRGHAPA